MPNVRPVLVLSGSDHDMGYQHAQQLIQIYGTYYMKGAASVTLSENQLASLREYGCSIEETRTMDRRLCKGDRGWRNCSRTLYDLRASTGSVCWRGRSRRGHRRDKKKIAAALPHGEAPRKMASLYVLAAAIMRCGSDSKTSIRYEIVVMYFPQSGNNFLVSPPTGGSGHPGMNNKGVVYAHHGATGYCARAMGTRGQDTGIPGTLALLHVLRFANTAEQARDLVLSVPTRIGGLWADVDGTAFVIENRDNPRLIRKPGDNGEKDFIYATNNVFSKELGKCYQPPAGQKVAFVPHAGWLGTQGSRESIPRNLGLWNLFHNYHGHVDLNFAKMAWRFTGDAPYYNSIEEAVGDFDNSQGKLWNGKISETGNAMVGILQPDKGDNGTIHVSHGSAARQAEPHWTGLLVLPPRTDLHLY